MSKVSVGPREFIHICPECKEHMTYAGKTKYYNKGLCITYYYHCDHCGYELDLGDTSRTVRGKFVK